MAVLQGGDYLMKVTSPNILMCQSKCVKVRNVKVT